jgi:hypothetical protein
VKVNVLDPGHRRTRMRAEAMPGEDAETVALPDALAPFFLDLCDPASTRQGERVKAR